MTDRLHNSFVKSRASISKPQVVGGRRVEGKAASRLLRIVEVLAHLGDTFQRPNTTPPNKENFQHVKYDVIQRALMSLTEMPPQERGYRFEKFLKKLFDAFALEAEKPFRLIESKSTAAFC